MVRSLLAGGFGVKGLWGFWVCSNIYPVMLSLYNPYIYIHVICPSIVVSMFFSIIGS